MLRPVNISSEGWANSTVINFNAYFTTVSSVPSEPIIQHRLESVVSDTQIACGMFGGAPQYGTCDTGTASSCRFKFQRSNAELYILFVVYNHCMATCAHPAIQLFGQVSHAYRYSRICHLLAFQFWPYAISACLVRQIVLAMNLAGPQSDRDLFWRKGRAVPANDEVNLQACILLPDRS
jgi:hypothetical protein